MRDMLKFDKIYKDAKVCTHTGPRMNSHGCTYIVKLISNSSSQKAA